MKTASRINVAQAVFSVVVLGLGLFMAVQTVQMGGGPQYAVVGPRAFPAGISAVLIILGMLELWSALRGKAAEGAPLQLDWAPFAFVAAALVVQLALLKWLGWVPVATFVFMTVSRALGSRSLRWDLLVAASMAIVTFLLFNYVLGLGLPWGVLFEPLATTLGVN